MNYAQLIQASLENVNLIAAAIRNNPDSMAVYVWCSQDDLVIESLHPVSPMPSIRLSFRNVQPNAKEINERLDIFWQALGYYP